MSSTLNSLGAWNVLQKNKYASPWNVLKKMQLHYDWPYWLRAVTSFQTNTVQPWQAETLCSSHLMFNDRKSLRGSCELMQAWGCQTKTPCRRMFLIRACYIYHTVIHPLWRRFRYLQDVGYHADTPEAKREQGEIFSVTSFHLLSKQLCVMYNIRLHNSTCSSKDGNKW